MTKAKPASQIPVFKPYIGRDTLQAAVDALELGWLGMGSYVKSFEEELGAYLELPSGRKVVAVNTCTSALHLALRVAGVGAGDEVLTPALNNIGDFQAIGMCGARPVFVDVREEDLGIDPERIEALLGPRVKAVIALHYMGIPCRIDTILEVAGRHRLRVVEDAAHAIGTRVGGQMVGSRGDLTCFSFDAIKTMTCIDGGAVVVRDPAEAEQLYPARILGMTQSNDRLYSNARAFQYDVPDQGFRYHLANLHASIGLSQLKKLPEFIENRRAYCRRYNGLLAGIGGIVTPPSDFSDVSVFHYVVRVLDGRREALADFLRERGIDTGIHWVPGNGFSWLKGCRGADALPVTDRIGCEILTLPLWSYMDDEVIERVAAGIGDFFLGRARATGPALLVQVKTRPFSIPITGVDALRLRAVTTSAPLPGDVERLTGWRNRFAPAFLTEFVATQERTRRWLTESVHADPSRVLFMIEEEGKDPIGYVGLAFIDWERESAEADSVVRGEPGHTGAMAAAVKSLIAWARSELGVRSCGVRVLADNPALGFYQRMGFREIRRTPLHRVVQADCVAWEAVEAPIPGARWLVHMELPS